MSKCHLNLMPFHPLLLARYVDFCLLAKDELTEKPTASHKHWRTIGMIRPGMLAIPIRTRGIHPRCLGCA